jgi:hypothetical protein
MILALKSGSADGRQIPRQRNPSGRAKKPVIRLFELPILSWIVSFSCQESQSQKPLPSWDSRQIGFLGMHFCDLSKGSSL